METTVDTAAVQETPADAGTTTESGAPPPVTTTQPDQTQPATEAAQAEQVDWKLRLREDPQLRSIFDSELESRVQKILSRERKKLERERLTRVVEDPAEALDYAKARKESLEAELGAEEAESNRLRESQDAVQAALDRRGKNPDWLADYKAAVEQNAKEAARLWAADPESYWDWAQDQIVELRAERKARKSAEVYGRAAASELANQALQKVPVLPGGGGPAGMSDDEFIRAYGEGLTHDHARARAIQNRMHGRQ